MKQRKVFSSAYLVLVLMLMYLPIAVVAVFSLNANTSRFTYNFTGFSLQYYEGLMKDTKGLVAALLQSLELALYSCLISAVVGTLGAVGMARRKFRFSGAIEGISMLPAMIPEIILAMGFLSIFAAVGVPFGMLTLLIAHVTFCIPYIFIVVRGRLAGLDPELPSAARDLGASPVRAFFDVTLPLILPGIFSGTLLAFAMSMDDFVISFFVTGPGTTTLPIKIYSSVRMGVSLQVNALSTMMLATVFLVIAVFRLVRQNKQHKGRSQT